MNKEIDVSQKYGYVRVSFKSQQSNSSMEFQTKELIRKGILENNIRIEVGSAANSIQNRSVFHNLIENELNEDDLLMATKIDRCSRDTFSFFKVQDTLFKRSITFVVLDLPNSTDLVINKLIATSLSESALI
jgi:DNA invertase Pin-like site-specific DNA recombinase